VSISRLVTEWLLPALTCRCCGQVSTADAPPGAYPGSICYGPGINTAVVLLAGYGNVPAERTALLIGMLVGVPVSAGFVDKAASRLDGRLRDAGFDDAMRAALAAEPALGADETPVSVLTPEEDPDTGEPAGGSPHSRSRGQQAGAGSGGGRRIVSRPARMRQPISGSGRPRSLGR
jgi:Transposase IS66 family